ncbi:cytochrome C biogenesis protein [Helicobacter sp. MIT 21-1697]|uniref:cytochrome c biogenesis CcdA family protein n=1 Tax=Helicobacter sp. MIT 21-1697 TaxID=2993733 RepID=UPI00224A5651|nr:cytochrome c biogenesis protein CcdA [Helicobacter sp. MIT 21-1697]MCX2716684.1 cytochrome C biogenesis protein [Helicobacter sp. MIT 21-1697]
MNLENALMILYNNMPFGASFLAGILTFLSPCILPLIPPYISYISGVSIRDLHSKNTAHKSHIVFTSLLFIAGFSFVFITLGIFASTAFGTFLISSWMHYIAGGIIIIFGIHFLFPFRLHFLYKSIQYDLNFARFGFLSPFVLGVGFSIGWSPCVGPILTSILTLSLLNPSYALWLMICYSAGLGLAFLLVAVFVDAGLNLLKKLTPFLRVIEIISGLLLILIGMLIIVQKTDFLLFLFS